MITDYKSRKEEVLRAYQTTEELVAELQKYYAEIELPELLSTERIKDLLNNIRSKADKVKNDRFKIVIAGESKSGKSTFINAYLGIELLPMDVKQCTSAIVEIKCGEKFSVKATYADDRTKEISCDKEAREFLKKNAAIDDEYRDIPVPTINSEILVKSGRRALEKGTNISINSDELDDFLKAQEIIKANIYNRNDYNKRIVDYINSKLKTWRDIVTKIEIFYPLGKDFRGTEFIDSPGVCARGGVAEITENYIKEADAVIFLKPVIGQSFESTQFNQFMENVSEGRNRNALFLVLTRIANVNGADFRRLESEANKQFSGKLDNEHILFVDSKAELYAKHFEGLAGDKIIPELKRMKEAKTLDDFVTDAFMFCEGKFVEELRKKSRFDQVNNSLEKFGRNAHYILMDELLKSIGELYEKLMSNVTSNVKMFLLKGKNPLELAKQIAELKEKLDTINIMIYTGIDALVKKYNGSDGEIMKKLDEETEEFLSEINNINSEDRYAFKNLEQASMSKIQKYVDLTKKLQKDVVDDFDKELVRLSNKKQFPFIDLKPTFTDETFCSLMEKTSHDAYEVKSYEEGLTFKKTRTRSVYSQDKHFKTLYQNIIERLEEIKNVMIDSLFKYVLEIRKFYYEELCKNADAIKKEYDTIFKAKISAEKIAQIIDALKVEEDQISKGIDHVNSIKGGIEKCIAK